MKVTVLSENTSHSGFQTEHGLCLFIETQKHKILFDFGASPLFVKNAEKLGVDLGTVDVAFLSHGHYDHGGGMEAFLEINKIANIYMQEQVFEPHYNARNEYIGLDVTLDGHPRFIKVREDTVIDGELSFVTMKKGKKPVETHGLKVKRGKSMEKEDFVHEMYLQIHEGYKNFLISGCSHKGLINLIYTFRFDAFVGGFHFMKVSPQNSDYLDAAAEDLLSYPAMYYTCHCTGLAQYGYLKKQMGDRLAYIAAGQSIKL